jgi:ADP-ribosylglycohydrolase
MTLSAADRSALAMDALVGLSTADAVGNQGFPPQHRVVTPGVPEQTFCWTDDTEMACSLVDMLNRYGTVHQAELAAAFTAHAERHRDYGMGALSFLDQIQEGTDWRTAAASLFGGNGSYGNGGAMRVTPLGAFFADDLARAATEAAASAEVTHANPEAIAGAVAAAVAAAHAASTRGEPDPASGLIPAAVAHTPETQLRQALQHALDLLGATATEAATALGNGSKISALDTVPFTLWVATTHFDDYEAAIRTCVAAGGDMDTTSAIVGGILTAHHGPSAIPKPWLTTREPLPTWLTAQS